MQSHRLPSPLHGVAVGRSLAPLPLSWSLSTTTPSGSHVSLPAAARGRPGRSQPPLQRRDSVDRGTMLVVGASRTLRELAREMVIGTVSAEPTCPTSPSPTGPRPGVPLRGAARRDILVTVIVRLAAAAGRRADHLPVVRSGRASSRSIGAPVRAQSVATARAVASALFCAERGLATYRPTSKRTRADEQHGHGQDHEDRGDAVVVASDWVNRRIAWSPFL